MIHGVSLSDNNRSKSIININQSEIIFDNVPTISHAIEDSNYPIHEDCRMGTCGSCKMNIISGKVKYLISPEIKLKENEILPCCCIPEKDIELLN